jgi:hypothetical protein
LSFQSLQLKAALAAMISSLCVIPLLAWASSGFFLLDEKLLPAQ